VTIEPVPAAPPPPTARRPDRRIAALLVVALAATGLFVGFIWLTRPPGGSRVPDTIAKGEPAPAIAGSALDGTAIDLAQLRGHPVVINFWASWCGPCQQEMPLLAQKASAHAGTGLAILGVLSDDTVPNGQAFERQYGATWPSVFDANGAIKTAYHVLGRPQSYFVDRDGILRSIQIGYLTDADFERQFALIAGGS
jgi:cytochrome c biogenesis protein CcmG/thiol:disulfide interchange protein DsbE